MSIGTSNGAFYEDEFHMSVNPYIKDPNSTPDKMELSPNEVMPHPEDAVIEADSEPNTLEVGYKGIDNVPVLRVPANDNKNLNLGDGIDLDKAWSDVKKKLGSKPSLTVVPK